MVATGKAQEEQQARAADLHRPLVVQVVRQYLPNRGGLEDVVRNLSRQLLARGLRVRVVTLDRLFADPGHVLAAREVIDGVEVVRIPWRGSSRYPLAPAVFRHLADADLIHVHGVDFFFDALAFGRCLHGKPMVATTHGGFFHTSAHGRLKRIWFNTATRLSGFAYRAIICCSASDLALFQKIHRHRSVLIENGVDTLKFAGLAPSAPRRRLLTIGRFSRNKRLERLLDVMAALVAREPDWHLDIAGAPSDLTESDLSALIASHGLERHVNLHVRPGDLDLRRLAEQASLFVSASDYEGFGLVAVEAMSAGLLPVLNANQAYQALAEQHRDVQLADFSKPARAADAVEKAYRHLLAEGEALPQRLVSAAARYSWEGVTEAHLALYADALPRSAGKAWVGAGA
ncbi:alpha-1,3-mannosyltransferase [Rhizobium paknamense]|uniref:Alpha-1,3-mannosyltransferase n=2 Tax=Rhizobium paknamense TaxID=1206817 RepID=A0ABU0ILQ3_9HYPH|nr:glycosyltransferase family 4 protein [Rhizobium paknamense]MDQ0458166.1 alpha-1,3-mannosyltransferase [Rhizobium paknamense]